MATPDLGPFKQEMPPKEGFKRFNMKRNIPISRGPPGWALFAGTFAMTSVGFYYVGQGNIERRLLKQEERECRITLLPILQAESDAEYITKMGVNRQEERELMAKYPNYESVESVYHSKKHNVPLYAQKR